MTDTEQQITALKIGALLVLRDALGEENDLTVAGDDYGTTYASLHHQRLSKIPHSTGSLDAAKYVLDTCMRVEQETEWRESGQPLDEGAPFQPDSVTRLGGEPQAVTHDFVTD